MLVRKISPVAIVAAIALAGFAPSAFAYLDPSTGSMILSAILGIFATVGLALKTYWYKLKALFRGKPPQPPVEVRSDDSAADASGNSKG
jgi:hypothetical protein